MTESSSSRSQAESHTTNTALPSRWFSANAPSSCASHSDTDGQLNVASPAVTSAASFRHPSRAKNTRFTLAILANPIGCELSRFYLHLVLVLVGAVEVGPVHQKISHRP